MNKWFDLVLRPRNWTEPKPDWAHCYSQNEAFLRDRHIMTLLLLSCLPRLALLSSTRSTFGPLILASKPDVPFIWSAWWVDMSGATCPYVERQNALGSSHMFPQNGQHPCAFLATNTSHFNFLKVGLVPLCQAQGLSWNSDTNVVWSSLNSGSFETGNMLRFKNCP